MYFYCNETTQFLCANYTATESCGITAFPQIDLPQLMETNSMSEWIQTLSFFSVIAVIIAIGSFYVFSVRKKTSVKPAAKKTVRQKAKPVKEKPTKAKLQKVNAKEITPEKTAKINSSKKNTKKVR
jgi:preprotein translocase subunit SecF